MFVTVPIGIDVESVNVTRYGDVVPAAGLILTRRVIVTDEKWLVSQSNAVSSHMPEVPEIGSVNSSVNVSPGAALTDVVPFPLQGTDAFVTVAACICGTVVITWVMRTEPTKAMTP